MSQEFDELLISERIKSTKEHSRVSLLAESGVILITIILIWNSFDSVRLISWGIAALFME